MFESAGEVCSLAEKILASRGIKIHTNVKIENLVSNGETATATLSNGEKIETERVLVATGRRPNTANIGLETIGLSVDRGVVVLRRAFSRRPSHP